MTITVDLYAPYRSFELRSYSLMHLLLQIKFHVVTQAYTAMNKIRIRVMKEYGAGTHEYRALKRFLETTSKKSR